MSKLTYQGDCMTGLRSPRFRTYVASDADELGQIIHPESGEVTYLVSEEFAKKVDVLAAHQHYLELDVVEDEIELGYNVVRDVAWIYEHTKNVHYFYARNS